MVSWDTYPTWHKEKVIDTVYDNGMCHDLMRSLKGKPFFQMESCPTSTNWQSVSKLKKPGMLFAQSMQAIAHGGEGALYFQIRQSRGASEKFHGAVIDHYGGNDTRVFKEVSKVGAALKELREITCERTERHVHVHEVSPMTAAIVPTPLALCPTEYVMRISSTNDAVFVYSTCVYFARSAGRIPNLLCIVFECSGYEPDDKMGFCRAEKLYFYF